MNLFNPQSRLEWHAQIIRDPIERLRYLRLHGPGALAERPASPWLAVGRRMFGNWQTILIASLFLCTMVAYAAWLHVGIPGIRPAIPPPSSATLTSGLHGAAGVWLVEQSGMSETYSNGLRIDSRFAVANIPRGRLRILPRDHPDLAHMQWREGPAGIVFHTTESRLAPFEPDQNHNLRRIGEGVLSYVRQNRSYHFLIDRFGRVFRIVRESDVAYHSGQSVWADDEFVYVNLNSSFLGVAFETQTGSGDALPTATPAQIDAARILTEMLTSRYLIRDVDCVTHAQVSVNPSNWLMGYHTDWAGKFPFAEIGLKDNYTEPPASIWAFGFDYDPAYVLSTGARLRPGLVRAEAQRQSRADELRLSLNSYRAGLRRNYREITAAAPVREPTKENAHEQ